MKISEVVSKTKEAVRPKHVHALIRNDHPPAQDKVKFYAGQVEKHLDHLLHRLRMPTNDMKVAYSEGQIHVVIMLKWLDGAGPDGQPWMNIRIGLGDTIARFPIRFEEPVKQDIIQRYSEVGWNVEIRPDRASFYHPVDAENHLK